MNISENFSNQLYALFEVGIFNIKFLELIIILTSLLLSFFIRSLFANFVVRKIKSLVKKSSNKIDDSFFDTLHPPFKILPAIIVLLIISLNFEIDSSLNNYLKKINSTLSTIFIFSIFYQLTYPLFKFFDYLEVLITKALFVWISKSVKYLIVFLAIVAVLDIWGIKIGPIIAGLGLIGVAIALGAQDLFKNLISGLLILVEKRFQINDIIKVPGYVEGVVEHIGFRSTLVRKFDSTPMSIPNHIFSENPTLNLSSRFYRRISWSIGLIYSTDIDQLKNITNDIKKYLKSSQNFISDDSFKSYVNIEKFNDSSIDIYISSFVNTTDWGMFLKIKEDLSYELKKIIKENGSDFAYPSSSIYVEKKL